MGTVEKILGLHALADQAPLHVGEANDHRVDLAPADTVLYVAMPNLTEGLGAARQIFSSRLADSEVLSDWWQREIVAKNIDTQIEESLDRLQFLGEAVGAVPTTSGCSASSTSSPAWASPATS